MTESTSISNLLSRWQTLALRERRLLLAAAALIVITLLWSAGISPALKVLRQSELQRHALDARLQQMQKMAEEARTLQAKPAIRRDEAARSLEASVKSAFGSGAQITFAGDRATITLKAVSPASFSTWLEQARVNARALPVEARMTRSTAGNIAWDGSLVMSLPPR